MMKCTHERLNPIPGNQRVLAFCLGLASVLTLAGCAPPESHPTGKQRPGPGPGGRAQELALTPQQELELGERAYREILSKSEVVREGAGVERVKRVGQKIARAAEIEPLQREIKLRVKGFKFNWAFNVIREKQINAFCLPGGKVVVYTGLLPIAANDDQLATVMAHEIAHALAHHGSERLARQEKEGGFMGALVGKSHDRQQESEADHIGLFLMTFAGYDPNQAVAFWERMHSASSGSPRPPEILSDHPSDTKRIAQMASWVGPARAAKHAFDEGNIAPPRR